MSILEAATRDLRWVAAYWPDLTEARIPGTARPWRQPELSPAARLERDRLARQERLERGIYGLGNYPAPVHEEILDLIAWLLADADELAGWISQCAGVDPLPPAPSGYADAVPYLDHAVKYLDMADEAHAGTAAYTVTRTRLMVDKVAHALALVYDGQRLDVECPWCRGVTAEHPAGGARTWRVRDVLATSPCDHGHHDRLACPDCDSLVVIVCEGVCEPAEAEVGTWWRGQPCWPVAEWDWLAKRVSHAEAGIAWSA